MNTSIAECGAVTPDKWGMTSPEVLVTRSLATEDPSETIQQTFVQELSYVNGCAGVVCATFLWGCGFPMTLWFISVFYGSAQIVVVWLLNHKLITSVMAQHLLLAAFLFAVTWDSIFTGGYKSPFLVFYTIVPLMLMGKAKPKMTQIWTVISMLLSLVVIFSSRIWPIESVLVAYDINVTAIFMRVVCFCMGGAEAMKFDKFSRDMIFCLQDEKIRINHATHAKAEFLAVMSHEIRTPLQGVIGWVDLLRGEPVLQNNFDTKTKLKYLTQCSSNLKEVVSNILDYSKISEGKFIPENTPFSIQDIFDETLGSLQLHKAVTMHAKIGIVPSACFGPKLPIKQCLSNLVSNAIKFTPSGTIIVSCTADNFQPDKEESTGLQPDIKLTFRVQDTGIGISDDDQKHLFQAFQQVDYSIKRSYGGTGLGLAIVKSLSSILKGDAWCQSRPGEGSSFYCSAVVDQTTTNELERFKAFVAEQNTRRLFPRGPTRLVKPVLVVDDNKMNQLFITTTLGKLGIPYLQAWDGSEAVETFKNQKTSMIVMDYHMPRMNGTEAASKIRQLTEFGGDTVPIVALTGDTEQILVHQKNRNIFSDCIEKPFTVHKLSACVEKWVPGVALC